MRDKLTREDVTTEVVEAVRAYLEARAVAEPLREAVDQVEREILAELQLTNNFDLSRELNADLGPQVITEPKQVYLCNDEDQLEAYYDEVDARCRAAGLKPDDMERDFCPALVAKRRVTEAEWVLIEEAGKMLEMDEPEDLNNRLLCAGLEDRQKFIDLTVRLVVGARLL